jgi:hypothetical protein
MAVSNEKYEAAQDQILKLQETIFKMEDMVNEARQAEADADREAAKIKSFLRRYRYHMKGGEVMQKKISKVLGDPEN